MALLSTIFSILATISSLALAIPTPAPIHGSDHAKSASCTFTDAVSLSKGKSLCTTIVLNSIAALAGKTLDLTGLSSGTHVIFEGATTFGYEEWSGPLISVSGTHITVTGASGSVIDGNGARWWDGQGGNGGKTKPKFFNAHSLSSSTISGLTFKDSPLQLMSINGANSLTVSGITMNNANGASLGDNTDAFDIGSSNGVTISGANIINQDDCLAINSGSNIIFTGGTCNGGHGLSIGSVGGRSDNTVKSVIIESSTVKNSQNGLRFKTILGASGTISDITYKDVTLSGISKYGIVIEQDYENGGPTGKPTTGVPISDLTLSTIKGTVSSSATNVYILCGSGSCSGSNWSGVSVSGGKIANVCKNVPSGASC